jgi:hypothetical protein
MISSTRAFDAWTVISHDAAAHVAFGDNSDQLIEMPSPSK